MFRNQPQCRCFVDAVRGPPTGWTFEVACSVCSDKDEIRWLCLGCYQLGFVTCRPDSRLTAFPCTDVYLANIFCGSKTEGHMQDHFEESSKMAGPPCCVAVSITKKTFWCFKCKTSEFAAQHDTRLQMAFGLVMSKSPREIESMAAILRRLYRKGMPNPRCWTDLPVHRQNVFGNRSNVTIEGLVNKWQETLKGKLTGEDACGKKIIVMAGAGISVSAGIPDFRTPGSGLYYNLQSYKLGRPEDMFSMEFFKKNPYPFYHFAKHLWPTGQHRPTPTHYFVRLLQEKGLLHRMYTQNIDGLERLAGVKDENLVEAHGTFSAASCVKCRAVANLTDVRDAILAGHVPVICDACSDSKSHNPSEGFQDVGLIKPDIVFFGESLPRRFHTLMEKDFDSCDLLIIMGTSLKVAPFNRLVSNVPDTTVRLLVNREKQPGAGSDPMSFDGPCDYRDIWMESDCDSGVEKLVDMLGWRNEFNDLLKEREKIVDVTKPAPTVVKLPSDSSMDPTTPSRRTSVGASSSAGDDSPTELPSDRVVASSGRLRKVKNYDMRTGRGVDLNRFASRLATNASPQQRAEYHARMAERRKSDARLKIQKAMFGGGKGDLEKALEEGRTAGLSRWELQPSEEMLHELASNPPAVNNTATPAAGGLDPRRFQSTAAISAKENDADLFASVDKPAKIFTRSLSGPTKDPGEDRESAWDDEVKKQVNKCKDRLQRAMSEESMVLIEQELLVAESLGIPWIDTVDARRKLVRLKKRLAEMRQRRASQESDTSNPASPENQSTIDMDSPENCDLAWCSLVGCLDPHTHVAAWHVCEMCGYVGHCRKECGMDDAELEALKKKRESECMPEDKFCSVSSTHSRRLSTVPQVQLLAVKARGFTRAKDISAECVVFGVTQ
ncbi:Sir2 histone deacetylase Hst2 [Perkinsus chesapeaki]|uniref:Sir2 histone deacetylase Hst2 n=1 Tax=Perkinsus chesapeaki TaxID=330153 RepID=A0A7J6N2V5_PERCH|nr:Sir2 histone deacetylase Hst2 [Perkinsus chesapeaki]